MPGSAPTTGARLCAIPPRCRRRSARCSTPRTPMPTRCSRRPRTCRATLVKRDARAHQGGRQHAAAGRRALRLLQPLSRGRPASHLLPQAARRRRRDGADRRRRAREGQGLLRDRGRRAFARPHEIRLERRRARLGNPHDHRARRRARRKTCPTASSTRPARIVWTRDSRAFLYVEQDEAHRPFRVMLHRLGTRRRARTSRCSPSAIRRGSSAIAATRLGRAALISVHGHDASETHLVDLDDPLADAAPRRAAPQRAFLRRDGSRRLPLYPHQ